MNHHLVISEGARQRQKDLLADAYRARLADVVRRARSATHRQLRTRHRRWATVRLRFA